MLPPEALAAIGPVVAELRRQDVPWHLGGSVASSALGVPRTSLDVDLVADLRPAHVPGLLVATASDYYRNVDTMGEAISRRSCFNLIHLPTCFKVDVFVMQDRPFDRSAMSRALERTVDPTRPELRCPMASAEDVILKKLEWFRLGDEVSQRQWADVLGVLRVQAGNLDRDYLAVWAKQLAVADLLERAMLEAQG